MLLFCKIYIAIIALVMFPYALCDQEECIPMHARTRGLDLVCCGRTMPKSKNWEECQYKSHHLCKFSQKCACKLTVQTDDLHCSDEAPPGLWRDHPDAPMQTFQCLQPNFPNALAQFSITFHLGVTAKKLPSAFLQALSTYNVMQMEIVFPDRTKPQYGHDMFLLPADFFDFFKKVRALRIVKKGLDSENATKSTLYPKLKKLRTNTVLEHEMLPENWMALERLEMLSVINLTSITKLPENVGFANTLQYLAVQNAFSLQTLPTWIRDAQVLTYAKFVHTAIANISHIAALTNLKNLYLANNKIVELNSMVFRSGSMQELDLSANEICCLSAATFSRLTSLRYLDLSDNPIKGLPAGAFATLNKLKWLYLRHNDGPAASVKQKTAGATLAVLTPDTLSGLGELEYLSLENNPNVQIHHHAFASLTSLKSVDLSNCNLSSLPDALIHTCHLRYAWLKFNRFRSYASVPPGTLSMLPLHDMVTLDISENQLAHNPYALFLIPVRNVLLMQSVVKALLHQPFWWNDPCARHHWRRRLVDTNPSHASRTLYAKLLSNDERAENSSGRMSIEDARQCQESYEKLLRDLTPYSLSMQYTACARLNAQRRLNGKLKRQLHSWKTRRNNTANVCINEPGESLLQNATRAREGAINGEQEEHVFSTRYSDEDEVQKALEHATDGADSGEDAKAVKDKEKHKTQMESPGPHAKKKDNSENLDNAIEECAHLYSTIDILGYVLAANFILLVVICALCIVLLFKNRKLALIVGAASRK